MTNFKWVIAYWSSHSHVASSVFQITCEKQSTPSASEWAKRRLAMLLEFVWHFNSVSWGCCLCLLLMIQPLPLGSLYASVPSHCLLPCLTVPLTMLTFFRSQAPLSTQHWICSHPYFSVLLISSVLMGTISEVPWGPYLMLSEDCCSTFAFKKKKKKKSSPVLLSSTDSTDTISRIPPSPEIEFPGPRTFE